MKKKSIWIITAAVLLIFAVLIIVGNMRLKKLYNKAVDLYEQKNYSEAKDIFSGLKNDSAEEWLEKCDQAIAEQEAQKLLDEGKPDKALALLKKEYKESRYVDICEQAIYEQRFASLLKENNLLQAEEVLNSIRVRNIYTKRLTEAELNKFESKLKAADYECAGDTENAFNCFYEAEDEEGMSRMIADMKEKSEYSSLYAAYSRLGDKAAMEECVQNLKDSEQYETLFFLYKYMQDETGMREAVETMFENKDYLSAFHCAMELGDIELANNAFDTLTSSDDNALITDRGNGYLNFEEELADLLLHSEDGADALAEKIILQSTDKCRKMIADNKRTQAYSVLTSLKRTIGNLWTAKEQALIDSCVDKEPDSSQILKNTLSDKTDGKATITVHNRNETKSMILEISEKSKINGKYIDISSSFIKVYVRPKSDYTFTIPSGMYSASVKRGNAWFGDSYGPTEKTTSVAIKNNGGMTTPDENLAGNYSITVD